MTESSFDFALLSSSFEACAASVEESGQLKLKPFYDAMRECIKVFKKLGSSFSFAYNDLASKLTIIKGLLKIQPDATVADLLQYDIGRENLAPNDKPVKELGEASSATRAMNRAAHVCGFVSAFFSLLYEDSKMELNSSLSKAYPETLGRIHTWIVRGTVTAAMNFAPYRADFMNDIGVSDTTFNELGKKFSQSSNVVAKHVEKEFKKKKIPWVF